MSKLTNTHIGAFRIDLDSHQLTGPGGRRRLPRKVMAVLRILMQRWPSTVSRYELVLTVWDGNQYTGPKAVTNAIYELRRAGLNEAIETIPGLGYRLRIKPEAQSLASGTSCGKGTDIEWTKIRPWIAALVLAAVVAWQSLDREPEPTFPSPGDPELHEAHLPEATLE